MLRDTVKNTRFSKYATLLVLLTVLISFGCQNKQEDKNSGTTASTEQKTPVPLSPPPQTPTPVDPQENATATLTAPIEESLEKESQPEPQVELPPLEYMPGVSASQILEDMVAVYQRGDSYTDHGYTEILIETSEGQTLSSTLPSLLAFQKPNFVRMEMSQGKLVCDGASTFAIVSTESFPEFYNTVLENTAPERTTIPSLFPDHILMQAMDLQIPSNLFLLPPQVILLFAEDPLLTFCPPNSEVSLLEPQYYNNHACDCISVSDAKGQRIFWIRRDTQALVRIDLPTDMLMSPYGKITSFRIEMPDAQLNVPPHRDAFQMAAPDGAIHAKEFVPPEILALGNVPNYNSVIDSLGKPVKLGLDEQKITVAMLFSTEPGASQDCQAGMEVMKSLAVTFIGEPKVTFHPISIDGDDVSVEKMSESMRNWNTTFPFFRMTGPELARELNMDTVPTFFIFDTSGRLQLYLRGVVSADVLAEEIRKLLAGEDIFVQWKNENDENQNDFRTMLARYVENDIFYAGQPKLEIAAVSEPTKFQREKLWEKKLQNACNPVTISFPDQDDLIVVPNHLQYLSVITKTGEFVLSETNSERILPEGIAPSEPLHVVRETLTQQGKRYLASFAPNGPKIYFFDDQLNTIGHWPPAEQSREMTVGDVRMTSLTGMEQPEIFASLISRSSGKDQISRLGLDGKTIWNQDEIVIPDQLALVNRAHVPSIWTIDHKAQPSQLVEMNLNGEITNRWSVENAEIWKCAASDLDGDGNSEVCAVLVGETGFILAGIDLEGKLLWNYPFPAGNHEAFHFEFLTSGNVTGDPVKEWILVSADSVIHIIDSQGQLVDQIAYGKPITGITAVHWDGHPTLVVTDNEGITAWKIGE